MSLAGKARVIYSGEERDAIQLKKWHYCEVKPGDYVIEVMHTKSKWIVSVKKIVEIRNGYEDKEGYNSVVMHQCWFERFMCADIDTLEHYVTMEDDDLKTAVVRAMKQTTSSLYGW